MTDINKINEQELEQVFYLADEENEVYRCRYCEEKYRHSAKHKLY